MFISEGSVGDDYSSGSDFNEEDIEKLLDDALPDDLKNSRKENQYEEKYKIVLEEKGHNHFEVLPEGWVQVTHNSGMPLYLHKTSRVLCVSRPYFLGPGSVRVSCFDFLEFSLNLKKNLLFIHRNMKSP